MMIDLLLIRFEADGVERTGKTYRAIAVIPLVLILLNSYAYSSRIISRGSIQIDNLVALKPIYPLQNPEIGTFDSSVLWTAIDKDASVFFMSRDDFYYDYYGGYSPKPGLAPFMAWNYKNDVVAHCQSLLDSGYYIVVPQLETVVVNDTMDQREILAKLNYRYSFQLGKFLVVSNRDRTDQ